MSEIVKAHEQLEHMDVIEVIGQHINRKEASQGEFDKAKKFLTKLYGGKRCAVCEARGEKPQGQIESHHVIEWCHANEVDMKKVEMILRVLSPLIHGLYMMNIDEILTGDHLYSLWNHPELKDKPFTTLDDPRNQWFLCHAHHQQATKQQIETGYDVIGLHHSPFSLFVLYFVMITGLLPMKHIHNDNHHEDGLDREV